MPEPVCGDAESQSCRKRFIGLLLYSGIGPKRTATRTEEHKASFRLSPLVHTMKPVFPRHTHAYTHTPLSFFKHKTKVRCMK